MTTYGPVMRHVLASVAAFAAFASPAQAQSDLERGFAGALRGCEQWVLHPDSWADGPEPFEKAVGLGNQMGLVERLEDSSLPPEPLRRGNLYWRINSTLGAGYALVVSDRLPMCHITGGGDTDLQPIVETVLSSPEFKGHWRRSDGHAQAGMITTVFRNRQWPKFVIAISRAEKPGQRLDRVQVLATAVVGNPE